MPKDGKIALVLLGIAILLLPTADPSDILTIPIYQKFGAGPVIFVGLLFLGGYLALKGKRI